MVDKRVKAGKRTTLVTVWKHVRETTERERLVLEGTERISPVCFHASRNAFAQAADAAGLTVGEPRELLDHESDAQTKGYQRRNGARATLVANVYKLAARAPSAPAGNVECSQGGHIRDAESEKPAHPVGFEPTTLGFEVLAQTAQIKIHRENRRLMVTLSDAQRRPLGDTGRWIWIRSRCR